MNTHPTIPPVAKKVIDTFQSNGFECYLVGGFLRDSLLERTVLEGEIDFATNARPEEIQKLFEHTVYENDFGTVVVLVDDIPVEVTTYRSESIYSDSRHPDSVSWGTTIHEDLTRRDFTMNALAYNGKELIDDWNGIDSINKRIITTVGNPNDRFQEDALRMIRAVRFAAQLGFTIEEKTLQAITDNHALLGKISAERIRDEFLKLLASDHAAEGIMILRNTKLLDVFLPELVTAFSCEQRSPQRHHIYDAGTHMVRSLAAIENPDPIVRMATLLHDIGKPVTRRVTDEGVVTFYNHEIAGTDIAYAIGIRMRLSKKELTKLTKLVRYHQFTVDERQTDSAIRRIINHVGVENINALLDVRFADRIGSGSKPDSWRFQQFRERVIEVQKKPFSVSDLAIDGNDVMREKNMKPGPMVGILLEKLFNEVVENKLKNDRESLLLALENSTT